MAANELTVNTITFYNIDEEDISDGLKQFARTTHEHIINLSGDTTSRCLVCVLLDILSCEADTSFENSIKQLINIEHGAVRNRDVVSSKENEYGGLIEFKNKQDLENDDPAAKIVSNIKTKLKNQGKKIFLWGYPEQTRELDGLNTQSWNDDRVASIERRVNNQLQDDNFTHNNYSMHIIPLGNQGDRWTIAGVIY